MHKPPLAPAILAHRGASAYAPENTAAAFQKAVEMGAKAIETDVSLLADNELVLFHDTHLKRCTGQDIQLYDIDLPTFRQYDIGSWFAPQFQDQFVWSLQDLQHWLHRQPQPIMLNLELKVHQQEDEALAQHTAQALAQWPATLLTQVMLSSFSISALEICQRQCPSIPRALLVEALTPETFSLAKRLQTQAVNFAIEHLDQALMQQGQQAGFQLYSYTCNDPDIVRSYLGKTLSGVFTDKPDVLLAAYPPITP